MSRFGLTEKQANAVLDLRLYQLTGLEAEKIEDEYKDLLEKIARYKAILASEALVRDIIRQELEGLKKGQQKSERKTKIIAAEGEFSMEDLIADEQVVIAMSGDDYIKRMPIDVFREQRRGGSGVIGMEMKKEADILKNIYIASSHDTLLIFTTFGRCYWTKVWQIPEGGRRSKGRPIINLLEDLNSEEKVAAILRVKDFEEEGASILLATKRGVVKKTVLSAFSNPRRKGVYALNIDEGDELIAARMAHPSEQIMLFTRNGMAVRFDESLVRSVGRVARGVCGVSLKNQDDKVIGCEVVIPEDTILVVCENGFGKRSKVDDFRQTNRGGIGVRSIITSDRNGMVVAALSVTDSDSVILMSGSAQAVRIPMHDVRVMGRSTQGVRLVNIKEEGDNVVGAQKIEAVAEE